MSKSASMRHYRDPRVHRELGEQHKGMFLENIKENYGKHRAG